METITINQPVQAEVANTPAISDAEKARKLKRENPAMTAKEIAERIGRKATYVYAVLRFAKDIPHPKRGRPRKAKKVVDQKPKAKPITLDMIHEATVGLNQVRIDNLKQEIADLKTVIRYLEGKLYGAPV